MCVLFSKDSNFECLIQQKILQISQAGKINEMEFAAAAGVWDEVCQGCMLQTNQVMMAGEESSLGRR